jgi:succinate dehydrogenase/fumarate reductase flavoprotein subunit
MLQGNGDDRDPAYLLCDRAFLWKYGLGAVKPFSRSLNTFIEQGYLVEDPAIAGLAEKLELDPQQLQATVAAYNRDAITGSDPEFGRGQDAYQRHLGDAAVRPNPCVQPIQEPPFYAIAVYPGDLGTAAGLATDEHARVLNTNSQPVDGLYCCGNDMASVMEGAYPGPGITLGPALTFGFLAGENAARKRAPT